MTPGDSEQLLKVRFRGDGASVKGQGFSSDDAGLTMRVEERYNANTWNWDKLRPPLIMFYPWARVHSVEITKRHDA